MSVVRPSGTVTFVFTDIEGSTRRWESDPEVMRVALAAHDEVLRIAIEAHGGWLFKHTGDGVCAAFGSPRRAIDAAVDAQRALGLPVRMGIATGEVELRGDDYFGPPLNRAARVMAAGHGGQILVSNSTAALVSPEGLVDLGERRLRDLAGAEHLYQVRAEGLAGEFPALRTLDATPGNLPVPATSLVGRQLEVSELCELVRAHAMVTLTGVGGVGKTRLALQVAAELNSEFPDGVWLVELAPVGDPAAVADAVATTLGLMTDAGSTVAVGIAQAVSGRSLLLVLDNCEHVLDAAAELVDTILARTSTVKLLATSREGLRVGAERVWPVPSLDVTSGTASAAVQLFVERARALNPAFGLTEPARTEAVMEICRRLDGIALAIELAAARMVSMSPQDVRDRLDDRFRLLAGSRRGLERHQTLRHAVGWSYDLLGDDERALLNRCSVFADGFDLAAAAHVCAGSGLDEYQVLDLLDSLVRKSLIAVEQGHQHARYAMLETIRQYAEEQLATSTSIGEIRDRHACHYAEGAVAHWELWDGPRQGVALEWVDTEFANLRTGFRWAAERGDVRVAAAIAAHAAMLAFALQRLEPVGWAEDLLAAATAANIPQLPRLHTAASLCSFTGRPEQAVSHAQSASLLTADGGYDPFDAALTGVWEATAHRFAGRADRFIEICSALSEQTGHARLLGLCHLLYALPAVGRADEARALADETIAAAREHGNPFWIAFAFAGWGRAFADTEPARALDALHEGLAYARDHQLPYREALIARDAAALVAVRGELTEALVLFDTAIDSFHGAGNVAHAAATRANLAVLFDRIGRFEIAATLYGTSTGNPSIAIVSSLPAVVEHLRGVLGEAAFAACVAVGAAMGPADAMRFAREQIQLARSSITAVV